MLPTTLIHILHTFYKCEASSTTDKVVLQYVQGCPLIMLSNCSQLFTKSMYYWIRENTFP